MTLRDQSDSEARAAFGGHVADALPLVDAEVNAGLTALGAAIEEVTLLLLRKGFAPAQAAGMVGGACSTCLTEALRDA